MATLTLMGRYSEEQYAPVLWLRAEQKIKMSLRTRHRQCH
jgi:hypothetical protein